MRAAERTSPEAPATRAHSTARRGRRRMKIWQKLTIIGLAFLLPLTITAGLLVNESGKRLQFVENELRGLEYVRPLYVLLLDLSFHRDLSRHVLTGDGSAKQLQASTQRVDDDFAALAAVDGKLGHDL